jgi:endonuclease/exonuclease/phosphatase family metal-dependent hydrolase
VRALLLRFSLIVLGLSGCVRPTSAVVTPITAGPCRSGASLEWFAPSDPRERKRLDAWCAGVGEAEHVRAAAAGTQSADMADVVFVSWNVHVGSGDIRSFVTDLKAGEHTAGRRFPHYILLLQEAVRTDDVPAFMEGASGAKRIASHNPAGPIDIVHVSRELGASLIYVPSMRNGRSAQDPAEDRGSAILSTLPLLNPAAIELPGERQRRVVITARAGAFSVGVIHLDALGGGNRLRLFWTPLIRDAQVRSLASMLPDGPLVVGADLNTWHGRDEPAARSLARLFASTPLAVDRRGLGLRVLDYMFFRAGPQQRARYHQVARRYGSDHRPLVGWIE